MVKNQRTEGFTSRYLLLGIFCGMLFGGLISLAFTEDRVTTVEKIVEANDKPMLLTYMAQWATNIDDETELIFNTYTYNFGNVEAKDVVIECIVSNQYDVEKYRTTYKVGNIASNSNKFSEFYLQGYYDDDMEDLAECHVKSSSSEFINLIDNIYDL